jgi:murein DD-endopeptidase MepM/ murein hydrolase activator NlpD
MAGCSQVVRAPSSGCGCAPSAPSTGGANAAPTTSTDYALDAATAAAQATAGAQSLVELPAPEILELPDPAQTERRPKSTRPKRTRSLASTSQAPNPGQFEGTYPTGERGKIVGTPGHGTHTLGDWQSDNALDIRVPEGTAIIAVADGTITRTGGDNNDPKSRFNGFKFTLQGAGNSWFYTHLSKAALYRDGEWVPLRDGMQVRRGEVIGLSGSANSTPHLHIGQEHGDPRDTFGVA